VGRTIAFCLPPWICLKRYPDSADKADVEHLWELYRDLGNSLDLDETLSTLDSALTRVMEYDAISIHLEDSGRLRCAYAAGHAFEKLAALDYPRELPECGLALSLQIPIEAGGQPIGALAVYRTGRREFVEADRAVLRALAPKLAASIGNARRFRRAEAANRRALFERLDAEVARIRRSHGSLAVLECAANGLEAGGTRLDRMAAELRRACREYDFVAQNLDSVIVVLADLAPDALDEAKARIENVFRNAGLRPRIGAALFPVDGYDAEDLLASAHGAAHA